MTIATALNSTDLPTHERMSGAQSPTRRAEVCVREIHRNNRSALLRFLGGLVSSDAAHTAEDLVQETMLRAWRNLDVVPTDPESQRRWLFTVGRRVAIDAYRKRQSRPAEISLVDTEPADYGNEVAETAIAKLALQQAMAQLSSAHRSVLVELHVNGHSHEEAAARLAVPVGTVKSRAHYAMKVLRTALDWTEVT
ncbi:sigma-70 family RNA polymerase sigma factor [Catellatospora citrea]|uniref:RNA polymerase sigma factor n=1 Tax=Catellatospora citrea TaxID=53366 RepID=A0A8J3P139_9ACTN|nr:sigma-70 family RNA polymerase sigma factor [Catellatospora citrea]RKE05491.1 RNA polymerase sigma-70 factor (ECF subfamily) [Catellatospora citrea]GIG00166.1 RNA polymerase sigma factor [Catellatospora citrea]